MQFEWDQGKAAINLRKHGVTFIDATFVFSDPLARIFPDPDHSETEPRELVVGYDGSARLLFISFVERLGNVRIISARRATPTEARKHEKYIKQARAR